MKQRTRLNATDLLSTDIDLDVPYSPLGKFYAPYRPSAEGGRFIMLPIEGRKGRLRIPSDAKESIYERT